MTSLSNLPHVENLNMRFDRTKGEILSALPLSIKSLDTRSSREHGWRAYTTGDLWNSTDYLIHTLFYNHIICY